MGHAAYTRGSKAISADIDRQVKATKRPDWVLLMEAEIEREKRRADKAEQSAKDLALELAAATRCVRVLRAKAVVASDIWAAERDTLLLKVKYGASAIRRLAAIETTPAHRLPTPDES